MFRFEKIIIAISFFLILIMGTVSSFNYSVDFSSKSECIEKLKIATHLDKIKFLMPEGECGDIGINLNIEEHWCGIGGIPKLHFNESRNQNYTICEITLKKLYEDTCWSEDTKLRIGEITDKYWNIQFGWEKPNGASYVEKWKIKVLNEDDYNKECDELNKFKFKIWLGITIFIISITKLYYSKKMRLLEIIGIIIGLILTLL